MSDTNLDAIAERYHSRQVPDIHIERMVQEFELEWILEFLHPTASVIDLGYGDGFLSPLLAAHCQLTVVEGSLNLAQRAIESFRARDLTVSVHHSQFELYSTPSRVDVVLACHVLEHVSDPLALLNRMRTWLKPEGIAVVVVPNRHSIHRELALRMGLISRLDELSPRDVLVGHQRVYSPQEVRTQVENAGFSVLSERGFFIKPLSNSQMLEWSPELLRGLNELAADFPMELCSNIAFKLGLA